MNTPITITPTSHQVIVHSFVHTRGCIKTNLVDKIRITIGIFTASFAINFLNSDMRQLLAVIGEYLLMTGGSPLLIRQRQF